MAAHDFIEQVTWVNGKRQVVRKWPVINTSVEDEQRLMREAFYPLVKDLDSLDAKNAKYLEKAMSVFFEDGTFLTNAVYNNLMKALVSIGHEPVELVNDGRFAQPVESASSTKPTTTAWKQNGENRLIEYHAIVAEIEGVQV